MISKVINDFDIYGNDRLLYNHMISKIINDFDINGNDRLLYNHMISKIINDFDIYGNDRLLYNRMISKIINDNIYAIMYLNCTCNDTDKVNILLSVMHIVLYIELS